MSAERPAAETPRLTYSALKETFDAIKNAPDPCAGGHLVNPKVYRRGGWTNCARCGRAVLAGGD